MILLILGLLATVNAGPAADKESYKDQFCTDPRTMRKHAAYTEWADAYSCTRHRCQPGGRNLAIYTVGCKRVEAPESAIECEEVVEDTNMQFPFCCTRLRCLVVVRGEVWTRVLGQPWEVLPAAPWSHMYKMKKPPPADSTFLPKTSEQGPVYELSENESDTVGHDKVLRSGKKPVTDPEFNAIEPRAAPPAPPPDIVIALSTNNDLKEQSHKKYDSTRRSQTKHESSRHKRARKITPPPPAQYFEDEREREKRVDPEMQEAEEIPVTTDKPPEVSAEKFFASNYLATQKPNKHVSHRATAMSWTEVPQNQWNNPHEGLDLENRVSEPQTYQPQETQPQEIPQPKVAAINAQMSLRHEKPTNLQALVDAIGTRMRDIESVVQKMSEKVHQDVVPGAEGSADEKRISAEQDGTHEPYKMAKRPNTEGENYKRFSVLSNRGSKYLHNTDSTTEPPLIFGDTNLTGYFSDASNSVLRRSAMPKEPPPTYMAPVENRRSKVPVHIAVVSDNLDDIEKKRKKHSHKKRRGKSSHSHKKHSHSKDDKRKHFNRLNSGEIDKNVVSLEDSSVLTKK